MADLEIEIEKSEDTELGDALSDAFDSLDGDSTEDVSHETTVAAPPAEKTLAPVQTGLSGLDDKPRTEEKPPESPTDKPPHSWTPAERESWAEIPKNIQATIQRREGEIQKALSHSAGARSLATEFEQVVAPYAGVMNANQTSPMQAVSSALQSYASLVSGTPEVKARVIVDMIETYGLDINMLDSMLAGQDFVQPQDPVMAAVQEQLRPMQQFMEQQQYQQNQQAQQQYQNNSMELQGFMEANEFSGDLRNEMADVMQMHNQRGINLSLQEAYEKALLHRPDIQAVISQRQAAEQAQLTNQGVAQKQFASSSIPQGAAMMGGTPPADTMRQALEQAYAGE